MTDFTVIIPTCDRPGPLARCLAALSAQDYPRDRFQVVVVDDGGRVPAGAAAAPYRERLPLEVVRQDNGGPASARNRGASLAGGRFLAFTDDDCLPDPGWLAALAAGLGEGDDRLAGGRTVNALPANPCAEASQFILDRAYDFYNPDPADARFFASNNMALRADLYQEMGGFDPSFRTSEDRDFCDRWRGAGRRMVHLPGAVVRHAHALSLGSFWRQHLGYGRGAWRFHRAHGRRDPSTSTLGTSFHRRLLRQLPGHLAARPGGRLSLLLLLGVWQAANLAGFLLEAAGVGRREEAAG